MGNNVSPLPTCAKLIEVKDGRFLVPAEQVGWGLLDPLELLRQGPEHLALLPAGGKDLVGALLQLQPRDAQQLLGEAPLLAVSHAGGAGEVHHVPGARGLRQTGGLVRQQAVAASNHLPVELLPPVVDGDIQDGDDAICTRKVISSCILQTETFSLSKAPPKHIYC